MTDVTETIRAAREAYERREWPITRDLFTAAIAVADLDAEDLLILSDAAWWMGHMDESLRIGEEAYRQFLGSDRPRRAALAAMGMAVTLYLRGDDVVGSGWMRRTQRLLRDEVEGPEHGYVRYLLEVEGALDDADTDTVIAAARAVHDIGRRHGDPNLVAAALVGEGRALVRQGRVDEGMVLLDEAMVAVLSERLSPDWAGNIYCHLMTTCHELSDIRRANHWTEATTRWLTALPAAVLFTGICRVHRSQILQISGAWAQAEREAVRVCEDLAGIHVASAAEGEYQVGEIRRVRGDLAGAEEAYQRAHRLGRDPQPGFALLRLAQGRSDAAAASIRAALLAEAGRPPLARFRLYAAQVEIALAGGDVGTAARASDALEEIARTYGSSGLLAADAQARGAVMLARGRPEEALGVLRTACRRWQQLDAPYDAGRVRVLLAGAYDALGDRDAAALELDAAAATFDHLGARIDAERVAQLRGMSARPDGLTKREVEVLALAAAGMTNRDIAAALVISQKTVARHLSNIFAKISVSTRTEAAAYAFDHGLAAPARE